jgi:hypothetical protein
VGGGINVRRFLLRSGVLFVCIIFFGYLLLRVEPAQPTALAVIEKDQLLVGAWLGDWPGGDNELLTDFEERTDARLDLIDIFVDWYTPIQNVSSTIEYVHDQGRIPVITWEPHGFTTVQIVEGTAKTPLRDGRTLSLRQYVEEFALGTCRAAEKSSLPVFMRPIHEMNGNWFWWGTAFEDPSGKHPNTNESHRAAWRSIHSTFEERCGDQIQWVWAVNHFSTGGTSWLDTYPGAEYVDYVGIDGYNWGANADWGWQSFHTVFREPYCAVTQATDKPILIAEIGSTEKGGDKAAWVKDAFEQVTSGKFPRVRGMVWFNDPKFEVEIQSRMDWPIDSSPRATKAFAEAVEKVQESPTDLFPLDAATPVCGR